MKIVKAKKEHLNTVLEIVQSSIEAVYPQYYTPSQVAFFIAHHNSENVLSDLCRGFVYLLENDGEFVGTVTASGCHITRLFVRPEQQRKGCGKALMDFAEQLISDEYYQARLDSSLPAYEMYKKRGYTISDEVDYDFGGGILHYQEMTLQLPEEVENDGNDE